VYGPPDPVLTDNGPRFAFLFFQGVCNLIGIRDLYTSTYHPQTNRQVKRFNKTLLDMFMHYIHDHHDNWDELVSVSALAYSSRPRRIQYYGTLSVTAAPPARQWGYEGRRG